MPGAAPDILQELRSATSPAHQYLETTLQLLDPALDLTRYHDILCRFYGFWQGWQPCVAALIDDPAFTSPRDRRPFLEADLLSLGLSPEAITALPVCPPPALVGAAAAWGSLYVLEGSTLGGRQILKTMAPRLGLSETRGATYFAGYGENTAPMWHVFRARLAATPDPVATVQGANDTFATLAAWLK